MNKQSQPENEIFLLLIKKFLMLLRINQMFKLIPLKIVYKKGLAFARPFFYRILYFILPPQAAYLLS